MNAYLNGELIRVEPGREGSPVCHVVWDSYAGREVRTYPRTPSEEQILRAMNETGQGEHGFVQSAATEARADHTKIVKALAAIVNVPTPDKLFDLDAIPRDPVMREVERIRAAADSLLKRKVHE
jgi:hypothetical protein